VPLEQLIRQVSGKLAIKHYGPGEHQAGFIGFRVNVAFGDKYLQRYFSTFRAEEQAETDPHYLRAKLEAQIQELQWKQESLQYQYQRFVTQDHPNTMPERGVGVHGLTAGFFGSDDEGWRAGFSVAQRQDGCGSRKGDRRFIFTRLPYSQAWAAAVEFWAQEHDIAEEDKLRVLASPPDPVQFKRLRRQINQIEQSADIPVEALSPVFAEQREELAAQRAVLRAKEMKLHVGVPGQPDAELQAEMADWFARIGGR